MDFFQYSEKGTIVTSVKINSLKGDIPGNQTLRESKETLDTNMRPDEWVKGVQGGSFYLLFLCSCGSLTFSLPSLATSSVCSSEYVIRKGKERTSSQSILKT